MNKRLWARYPYVAMVKKAIRMAVGIILVLLGLLALFTPLTPGSWLIPIGLEVLGLRILLENRVRKWADTHPNSRTARAALHFVTWRPRGWVARWRRRFSRSQTPGVEDRGAIAPDQNPSGGHETQEAVGVAGPEDKAAQPEDEPR